MRVLILKLFSYAEDGIHARDLVPGAVEEILDDLVPGLKREGFVADTEARGEGDDTTAGGEGADTVSGDDGDDTVSDGEGDDTTAGGEGADAVSGGYRKVQGKVGRWNVVDADGNQVNDKLLTERQADKLLADLASAE